MQVLLFLLLQVVRSTKIVETGVVVHGSQRLTTLEKDQFSPVAKVNVISVMARSAFQLNGATSNSTRRSSMSDFCYSTVIKSSPVRNGSM